MKESQTNSKIKMIDIQCKDREERLKRFSHGGDEQ